jgi:hypothetical protein
MDNMVRWNKLEINQTYYTKITGDTFGVDNPYIKVTIEWIWRLPNNEAMIFTRLVDGTIRGYAVGGKFENPLMMGPRNRFWKELPVITPNSMATAACAA